ncbi:mannose-1-phosphate guanylyltransferase/mannose-6-phosphate isomerase [Algihabitans albus]|uniref:mannose-1-phosphate guanylyltransferase/mannose-6-phosphate isomerase n=1 Tax=Algihabitans albus TaxID=2164067 RepID=UPI001F1C7646|nr:mannose-1-phosphate guanylyltransferase/mannose-6-phosphate isomerase [Algihabitans albus]
MIYPVILSGGSGTRLWPLSREAFPKQLLPLFSERSLLQDTVERLRDPTLFAAPLLIANHEHRFLIAEQLRSIGVEPAAIVLEPFGRNTAPAAALAALLLERRDPDAVMALFPADHAIPDVAALRRALEAATPAAEEGRLITFGVQPTLPETGYGYIRVGDALAGLSGVREVVRFVEKPDGATAAQYLESGDYLWNSGIFMMRTTVFLEELRRLQPAVIEAAQAALTAAHSDFDFLRVDGEAFAQSPSLSIDYAVMEHTSRAAVVPMNCGWSDVGAWQALWQLEEKDADANVSKGPVRLSTTRESYFRSEDGRLLVGIGVENLIVVATKDATLVTTRDCASQVGKLVQDLKAEGYSETTLPPVVYRPWGTYEDLAEDDRFRVKRIVVKPGASLSLQYHHHRSEHWVVVEGEAEVECDDTRLTVRPNESVYIPTGARHRLKNAQSDPLVLIEVQCGDYVGEDDIVRLEDNYGRTEEIEPRADEPVSTREDS